jgi:butanol dehydrogenase
MKGVNICKNAYWGKAVWKYPQLAWGVRIEDDAKAAEEGVKKLRAFYSAIKMPTNLREAGVKEEDLEVMAEKAVENGKLGILTSIGKDEALQIMHAAF